MREAVTRGKLASSSPYVFPSQRSAQLSEAGLHHWFRALKQQATLDEHALIADISFHASDDHQMRARSSSSRDLHLSCATVLPEEIRWFLGIFSSSSLLLISKVLIYCKIE